MPCHRLLGSSHRSRIKAPFNKGKIIDQVLRLLPFIRLEIWNNQPSFPRSSVFGGSLLCVWRM